jgi:hypothetical protein
MSEPSFPIELSPDSEELLENEREQELDDTEFVPLQDFYSSIVERTQIEFRSDIEAEILSDQVPDLDSGESESDEEPSTPRDHMGLAGWKFASVGHSNKSQTVIGGATVTNLALVVPDKSGENFGDLPVFPITGTGQISSQLVAAVSNEETKEQPRNLPLLILGDEEAPPAGVSGKLTDPSRIATISALSLESKKLAAKKENQKDSKDEPKPGKGTDTKPNKVATADLDSFVLSGDIPNLFGIKGLKGKLYKFKGEYQGQYQAKYTC